MTPKDNMKAAAKSSMLAIVIAPPMPRFDVAFSSIPFPSTAKLAMVPVVIAVPRAMAKVPMTPAKNSP